MDRTRKSIGPPGSLTSESMGIGKPPNRWRKHDVRGSFQGVDRKPRKRFWGRAAEQIVWDKKWDKVLDFSNPPFARWFVGGALNTCFNCLDVHVQQGRGDQTALIYDSPVTDTVTKYTYGELTERVAKLAGALTGLGVSKGDTVIIYMPMIPEAVMAMLACARIGAIHSVVFGGFAPRELAIRIDDRNPR